MIKIIYFVHGTTTDNASKLCSGWKEAMLNDLGIEQAYNLGNVSRDRDDHFDVIFTSDLKRAIDSSNIAFPNIEKITDSRLRECNYGDLDGKDNSIVIYEEHISSPFPNGESMLTVEKRIKSFLQDLLKNYDGKHIAIVAHKAPQLAIEVLLNNKTWDQAIAEDWRKTKAWQPGWNYKLDII